MEYIKVENNIVTELVSCPSCPETDGDWREVKLEGGIHVGDDVRMFDSEWNLRPLKDLVSEGYIELATATEDDIYPPGTLLEKIKENQIVPKSRYDFAKEGTVELHPLEYFDDENEEIRKASSVEELLDLGKIDQSRADELKAEEIREQRDSRLGNVDELATNPLRWGSLSSEQQEDLADYRQALLDVPQQDEFPWSVQWPTKPE